MAPSQQKVLYLTKKNGPFEVHTADVPKAGPGQLLVKVEATGVNPVDWKIQLWGLFIEKFPSILGSDIVGTVEELGEGVSGFAKGDRVLSQGMIGANARAGYQQYAVIDASVSAKVPANVTPDQAASIPACLATAAIGLFHQENPNASAALYPPWENGGIGKYKNEPIFVPGGASIVGHFIIQLARLAGFSPIITTASPHNTDALKAFGATHVIDRNLPADQIVTEVKKAAGGAPIKTAFDAVSLADTQNIAYDALAPGGTLVIDLPSLIQEEKKVADKRFVQVVGSANAPQNRKVSVALYAKLTGWLADGSIKPTRVEALPNGLAGVVPGLERLEKGTVSGLKLIALPQETA